MEIGYAKSTNCGYCNGKKPVEKAWALDSIARFMQGKGYPNNCSVSNPNGCITLKEYEAEMKDGWRRSGAYMYKPDLLRSCCRQYTIRTNYSMFVDDKFHNKSTKKIIRRFYREMCNTVITTTDLNEIYYSYDQKDRFFSLLLPNEFAVDKFELFKKYQMSIHHENENEISPESFYRFLCDDPLIDKDQKIDWNLVNQQWVNGDYEGEELQKIQGPVHECYIIDNKLVAIAVLDILPTTVSSVYFMWDPEYANLGLGTVSAIREIMMTKILKKEHYYMGFYIADCEKMIYKNKFGGEIRNFSKAKTIDWVKLKDIGNQLKDGKFAVFDKVDGKLVNVAEEQYGIESNKEDAAYMESFEVVDKTQLIELPLRLVP